MSIVIDCNVYFWPISHKTENYNPTNTCKVLYKVLWKVFIALAKKLLNVLLGFTLSKCTNVGKIAKF